MPLCNCFQSRTPLDGGAAIALFAACALLVTGTVALFGICFGAVYAVTAQGLLAVTASLDGG
jgi:hypothetical protein